MAMESEAAKADGMRELSMDELSRVTGGEMNDAAREMFIPVLRALKQDGKSMREVILMFPLNDLIAVIEEVWDSL